MGTNCAPPLADLFLHAYELDLLQWLLKNKYRTFSHICNSSIRFIDDVLSLNNYRFCDYQHHIYPNELEVKDTTDFQKSASYLDIHLEIDNGGRLKTRLYDKRDDFTFPIVNFPFISSNIPASPAYGVYISQLIRYSTACVQYSEFDCWCKSYSNKATLLKWQWIFYILRRYCPSSHIAKTFTNLTVL